MAVAEPVEATNKLGMPSLISKAVEATNIIGMASLISVFASVCSSTELFRFGFGCFGKLSNRNSHRGSTILMYQIRLFSSHYIF